MPKANTDATTPTPAAPTGDAVLLALAAAWREISTMALDFGEVPTPNAEHADHRSVESSVFRIASQHSRDHDARRDVLSLAIRNLPAETLAGALVQIEVMHFEEDTGEATDPAQAELGAAAQVRALWSVHRVLSRATGLATADCLGTMPAHSDPFRGDVATLVREWTDRLSRPDHQDEAA